MSDNLLRYSDSQPRSIWWVHKAYADITGTLVDVTASENATGIAGKDANILQANILLGQNEASTNDLVSVTLTGLDDVDYLTNNSNEIRIIVQHIPDSGWDTLIAPTLISDRVVAHANIIDVALYDFGFTDAYTISLCRPEESNAPVPNPMTWATEPYATSANSISMTATTASDDYYSVEYYFECTTDGNYTSSWQSGTGYEATGLSPSTSYTFKAKARDTSPSNNETGWSDPCSATTCDANLMGWWEFEDDVNDSSGNGNHGTVVGSLSYVTGQIGNALSFLGSSDYVDIPDFDLSSNWTICLWAKVDNNGDNMAFGDGDNDDDFFYLDDSSEAVFENSSGANVNWTSDTGFKNTWRHVAVVADTTQVELYLDGVSQGTQSITPTLQFYYIGTGDTTANNDFDGLMDDVRYYNRVLNATEVNDIYEAGK